MTNSTSSPGGSVRPDGPTTTTVLESDGIVLGRDIPPDRKEDCRVPGVGTGAAWQLGPITIGGRRFGIAYYCNLVNGGTGSLEFVLERRFRELEVSFGFSDRAGTTSHMVRFDVIFDDKEHLREEQILRFGDTRDSRV